MKVLFFKPKHRSIKIVTPIPLFSHNFPKFRIHVKKLWPRLQNGCGEGMKPKRGGQSLHRNVVDPGHKTLEKTFTSLGHHQSDQQHSCGLHSFFTTKFLVTTSFRATVFFGGLLRFLLLLKQTYMTIISFVHEYNHKILLDYTNRVLTLSGILQVMKTCHQLVEMSYICKKQFLSCNLCT